MELITPKFVKTDKPAELKTDAVMGDPPTDMMGGWTGDILQQVAQMDQYPNDTMIPIIAADELCDTCKGHDHQCPESGCNCNKTQSDVSVSASDETDNLRIEIFRNRSVMECRIIDKTTGEVIQDRLPVFWKARENTLDYLSVSKIKSYEDCPASFYRQYMSDENIEEDSGNYYTKFGTILHEVVEKASCYFTECGIVINPMQIYDEVWTANPMPVDDDNSAFDTYLEGKKLIEDYFINNPVDKRPYITKLVEHEWRGTLGGCTFGLMIDHVGVYKNDPTVGIISDYKSNRMPFTPGELDESFQLKIYELVTRRHIMPEIERWNTGYEMFRYGWQQCPPRTMEDLLEAENYVASTWARISADNSWDEKLNKYCGYRKCRFTCKTYTDYVNNPKRYLDAICTDAINLAEVDKQRELMTTYEKIAKGRKDECAGILKVAIEDAMKQNKSVVIDGQQLELYSNSTGSYNYYDTKNVLLVNNALEILDKTLTIGKTKMDAELKKRPDLKMALSQCLTTNYATSYIVKKKYGGK